MIVYDIQNLSKTYPGQPHPANDAISLQIRQGEIFGLLGDVGFVAAGCMPADWSPAQARSYLARTIAHEAGHTFGLSHNANQASLMSQASTGFSLEKGPVPAEDQASCQRTTQDDFAVLRQVLGLRGER